MSGEKAAILIVEDSFIVAYHLRTILENEGYAVPGTIESGEAALRFLKANHADLVLMDIMLEGKLDGVETARVIRSEYGLPVIFITALTDYATIGRAKVAEPYGYVTKPFEDREIFTVVEMALYKHKVEKQLRQSEERYFSTIRSISDAVILVDKDFNITYANPSAELMLGQELAQMQRACVLSVLDVEDTETGETGVNLLQMDIKSPGVGSFPANLTLVSQQGQRKRIGDGSLSPLVDNKGMCTGLVILFKDLTHKIEHENVLKSLERERLAALVQGQENERIRISRDLHDGLGQMLTAIRMNISDLPAPDSASSLRILIDDAIQESVRISENLLPAYLRDFPIADCLELLCNNVRRIATCAIDFEVLGQPADVEQTVKINLFRICQEAMNNALKHADAKRISVALAFGVQEITLTVEDDGKGFVNGAAPLRNGLANMHDRTLVMNGRINIESDSKRGTLIIVEVPTVSKLTVA